MGRDRAAYRRRRAEITASFQPSRKSDRPLPAARLTEYVQQTNAGGFRALQVDVLSLALIGNVSAHKSRVELGLEPRRFR